MIASRGFHTYEYFRGEPVQSGLVLLRRTM